MSRSRQRIFCFPLFLQWYIYTPWFVILLLLSIQTNCSSQIIPKYFNYYNFLDSWKCLPLIDYHYNYPIKQGKKRHSTNSELLGNGNHFRLSSAWLSQGIKCITYRPHIFTFPFFSLLINLSSLIFYSPPKQNKLTAPPHRFLNMFKTVTLTLTY